MLPNPLKPGWTAIVPAAGRGDRLGSSDAKIFYPVLGRPLLAHLTDLLSPLVDQLVVVTAPNTRERVETELNRMTRTPHACAVQPWPKGMADAVLCAEPFVQHAQTLVMWGDQIAVRAQTLRKAQTLQTQTPHTDATFPTSLRANPYIRFIRNDAGRLTGVEEAREGTLRGSVGESDCGVFCFATSTLFETLRAHQEDPSCQGQRTAEYNLLPLLAILDKERGRVKTFTLEDPEETQGLNTPEEAQQVETILKKRREHP